MIAVGELFYVSISFDSITADQAQTILDFAIQERGTRSGISISFSDAIN